MRTIAGVVVMLCGVILFATTGDRVALQIASGVLFVVGSLIVFTTRSPFVPDTSRTGITTRHPANRMPGRSFSETRRVRPESNRR